MPYIGNSPKNNVRERFYYTATSGQTLFNGPDIHGRTLAYQDGRYVDVYLNGVILQDTTDYTATTKTSVTLVSGATTGDLVEIVAYGIFSVSDTVSAASGGEFAGNVTINARLDVDNVRVDGNTISSTDTNGDITLDPDGTGGVTQGSGTFTVKNADSDSNGLKILQDTSDTSKIINHFGGPMVFGTNNTERMRITSGGDVGIGTSSPAVPLDVKKDSPSSGILALFGSNGTSHTGKVSAINNNITIGRSRINVPASTTTQLVNGYGGSVCLITLLPASGVADIQYTFLVTHGWNAATVLFTNSYGGNTATFTFAASTGNLTVNHNHSGAINFNVATMVVSAPTTG